MQTTPWSSAWPVQTLMAPPWPPSPWVLGPANRHSRPGPAAPIPIDVSVPLVFARLPACPPNRPLPNPPTAPPNHHRPALSPHPPHPSTPGYVGYFCLAAGVGQGAGVQISSFSSWLNLFSRGARGAPGPGLLWACHEGKGAAPPTAPGNRPWRGCTPLEMLRGAIAGQNRARGLQLSCSPPPPRGQPPRRPHQAGPHAGERRRPDADDDARPQPLGAARGACAAADRLLRRAPSDGHEPRAGTGGRLGARAGGRGVGAGLRAGARQVVGAWAGGPHLLAEGLGAFPAVQRPACSPRSCTTGAPYSRQTGLSIREAVRCFCLSAARQKSNRPHPFVRQPRLLLASHPPLRTVPLGPSASDDPLSPGQEHAAVLGALCDVQHQGPEV
jgi:hypothetical protein